MKQTIFAAGLIAFGCGVGLGQSDPPRPTFEVASVKPAPPPTGMGLMIRMGGDKGRINYSNVSIRDVMTQAYAVKDYQIVGPDWLKSARYDIVATMPEDTPRDQVRLMMQALLADRFHLVIHRETKELPTYALTVGKNGPKLKEAEIAAGPDGKNGRMMMRPGHLEGKGFAMPQFAELLARQLGRPVLDMTELTGNYDFTLEFTPDENQRMAMMGGMPPPMHPPEGAGGGRAEMRAPEGGPSIFAAVQEQLGLKLESRKGPVETLVVDQAEKVPTEN